MATRLEADAAAPGAPELARSVASTAASAERGLADLIEPQPAGAPMYSQPGFGAAGPLEEFASTARTLLRQVGGPEAAVQDLAPPKNLMGGAPPASPVGDYRMPSGTQRMGFSPGTGGFSRVGPSPDPNGLPLHGSGQALAPLMPRAPAQPVNLKVLSLQGSAIVEEWSKCGTIRFETAVANRQWRQAALTQRLQPAR